MSDVSSLPAPSTASSSTPSSLDSNSLAHSHRKNHSLGRIMNDENDSNKKDTPNDNTDPDQDMDTATSITITTTDDSNQKTPQHLSPIPPKVSVTSESNSPSGNTPSEPTNTTQANNKSNNPSPNSSTRKSTKRHRPSSLDLKVADKSNSDVALRIVSPGLPQLNEEMKSTVKLSQRIEQQQRNLIAARQAGSSSTSTTSATTASSTDHNAIPHVSNSVESDSQGASSLNSPRGSGSSSENSNVTSAQSISKPSPSPGDEMDRLGTPTVAKRLKRSNIPTPLNISHNITDTKGNSNGKTLLRPSIQSAPIRPAIIHGRGGEVPGGAARGGQNGVNAHALDGQYYTSTPTTNAAAPRGGAIATASSFGPMTARYAHFPQRYATPVVHQQHMAHQRLHQQRLHQSQTPVHQPSQVKVVQQHSAPQFQQVRQHNPHAPYHIQVQPYVQYQQQLAQQQHQQLQQQSHLKRPYRQGGMVYQHQQSPAAYYQPVSTPYGQYFHSVPQPQLHGQPQYYQPHSASVAAPPAPYYQSHPQQHSSLQPHNGPHPYKRVRVVPPPYSSSSQFFPRGAASGSNNHLAHPPLASGPTSGSTSRSPTSSREGSPANQHNQITESPQKGSSKESQGKASSTAVTDVYHGDYTKAAPMISQPLSAQRDFFDNSAKSAQIRSKDLHDDDRIPVSREEMREMQEKYNSSVSNDPTVSSGGAIDHEKTGGQSLHSVGLANGNEIFGSINLMNESVFNFRIFNTHHNKSTSGANDKSAIVANDKSSSAANDKSSSAANDKSSSGDDSASETKKNKTASPEPSADANDASTATANTSSSSNSSDKENNDATKNDTTTKNDNPGSLQDRLVTEKEKFLKICETSWDEFVGSRV